MKNYHYSLLQADLAYQREQEERRKFEENNVRTESSDNLLDNIYEQQRKNRTLRENYNHFLEDTHDYLVENLLYTITAKAFQETAVSEVDEGFLKSLVHEYVTSTGYYNIINSMKSRNTLFLSESVKAIETYFQAMTEDAKVEDEIHEIDPSDREEYYKDLDNESIDNIADIIRRRVSQATEDFINKNIIDDMNTKDILADTKEKIDAINSGDTELDEEIKREQTMFMKKKLQAIENRPKSVFEQIVYNISKSVLSNEDIYNEYCTESGSLDMDKIVNKATTVYTFLEMLNTTKIHNFNSNSILESISFN